VQFNLGIQDKAMRCRYPNELSHDLILRPKGALSYMSPISRITRDVK
jgi:hypothetical protein